MFISEHVTLGNNPCNLCRNGATKLRDKLQEKLPSVTAPQDTTSAVGWAAIHTNVVPLKN